MNLVFFGTGSFAVPALRAISQHVSLVVTQPDRQSGRGLRTGTSPVKRAAQELGLRLAQPEKARSPEVIQEIRALEPDALIVASYGQILPQSLLDAAKVGGINLHGSILPRYRGAAPIQRAVMDGAQSTGVTLMRMDKGMDTGPIIDIKETLIEPDETYGELQDRLAEIASRMIEEWLSRIVAGDFEVTEQPESGFSIAAKLDKAEGQLNPNRSAAAEYNRFRGVTPNPGATLRTIRGLVKVSRAQLGTGEAAPGVVISTKGGTEIAFEGGSLILHEVQPEGKKRISGQDFANGLRLKPGEQLVEPTQ